ncbi:hypothetical protein Cni_G13898 [Canna indica]|uniref:Uncharacterized protein n=1 Tax=Canna indica TaxID=4628 RepID=A0AAQ3KB44_9LILI|nr:hypothetical protein Cni_G13898 [Canna indica]
MQSWLHRSPCCPNNGAAWAGTFPSARISVHNPGGDHHMVPRDWGSTGFDEIVRSGFPSRTARLSRLNLPPLLVLHRTDGMPDEELAIAFARLNVKESGRRRRLRGLSFTLLSLCVFWVDASTTVFSNLLQSS